MKTATEIVAPRMQALQKLEKTLKKLDVRWKVIETTARVVSGMQASGYIDTLAHTRVAFSALAGEMVEHIAQTHLENCHNDMASRAQVAVDMLVRNLFERTADVGFIATDAPLVDFVLAPQPPARQAMLVRLQAYRAKYTVYDDIVLLDTAGQVLLSLLPRAAGTVGPAARPDWLDAALAQPGHVERYGPSPLFADQGPVLLYAHRVLCAAGHCVGAVVLKFGLHSELASIFRALSDARTWVVLLDAQQRVVASSCAQMGVGERLRLDAADVRPGATLHHQGARYLYAHCLTHGYQGYAGPGWSALALVPLETAFDGSAHAQQSQAGPGDAAALEIEHPPLRRIVVQARRIEEDLNRVIWNGKLTEAGLAGGTGSALGPVFAEIGRTSEQTIAVFDGAISELKALLLAGRRAELGAHASLGVDLMDRNLYERANDCRWWALSEELAQLLAQLQGAPAQPAAQRAAELLAHLNSLYTVYRRVALFDRQGRILAVSRDAAGLPADASIPGALVQRTLALQGDQAYAVSAMEPHALADGAATYLFCAPIRQPGSAQVLGGIALAFHCVDELRAMLQDCLPVGSAVQGFFVDPAGQVLASTPGAMGACICLCCASGMATATWPVWRAARATGNSRPVTATARRCIACCSRRWSAARRLRRPWHCHTVARPRRRRPARMAWCNAGACCLAWARPRSSRRWRSPSSRQPPRAPAPLACWRPPWTASARWWPLTTAACSAVRPPWSGPNRRWPF